MTQTENSRILDLHTKAAYAHTAAAHQHSTGDHESPLDLARKALECSVEAVKYSEKVTQEGILPVALLEAQTQPQQGLPAQNRR
jgi:hypothetical protein